MRDFQNTVTALVVVLLLGASQFQLEGVYATVEREMTVNIAPMSEDCFFEAVRAGDSVDFDYQVIDGGHGELDINFHLLDPSGRMLFSDYKKSENTHRLEHVPLAGDYRFCFDNRISSYNSKTVFFELLVDRDGDGDDYSDNNDIRRSTFMPEEVYDIAVQEIQATVSRVHAQLARVRTMQDALKSNEARDRNVAEENYFKVNTLSWLQILVMLLVGAVQVVMVRSLFDDNSKLHKIWKNLHS